MKIKIETIIEEDINELTDIMTKAFDDDAQKHLGKDHGGPEGYNNGDFFKKWLFPYHESKGYKAINETTGKIEGAIIVWILPENEFNSVGTIFVDPKEQRKGIATLLWKHIEKEHPEKKLWILETPEWAEAAHRFYEKIGFHRTEKKEYSEGKENFYVFVYKKEP
ncbi:MAG: GNAT family N-acetyltransferase [Promethearchaeota archaeon]